MKKINKIFLELYNDRKQILFVSFLGYISCLIEGLIPSDPNVIQASGLVVGITGGVVALGGMIMGSKAAGKAQEAADANAEMANEMAKEQLLFQKEQQAKLDKQKDVYRAMEFTNPYEDLTVNQQQAQFQIQQGAQQRSNIMENLKGAAGGSGIAGLAQAMAGQGQLQAQQISASIGAQESQQQAMKTRGAAAVQDMERSRQSTLLGISMGESAGANAAAMQGQQNQLAAGAAQANIEGQNAANMYGMASAGIGMIGSGIQAGSSGSGGGN